MSRRITSCTSKVAGLNSISSFRPQYVQSRDQFVRLEQSLNSARWLYAIPAVRRACMNFGHLDFESELSSKNCELLTCTIVLKYLASFAIPMKLHLLVLALLLGRVFQNSTPVEGTIEGRVLRAGTGEPLPNTPVTLIS